MTTQNDSVAIKAFTDHVGTRIQTYTSRYGVWNAVLHDLEGDYAFKFTATGKTEDDALERLDRVLRLVVESAF